MKIVLFYFTLLFLWACENSIKNTEVEKAEDEFVAPKNPFSNTEEERIIIDTSAKAKKADKPGMKPAKVQFKDKEVTFDSIPAGKTFTTEIEFYNSGEQALEIRSVKSSKQADINWSTLLIGASESSSMSYKVKAPEKKGMFRDSIIIMSNAGEEKLLLKGTIR